MSSTAPRSEGRIAQACGGFVGGLREILEDDLVAVYFHGSAAFPETRLGLGDLDFHVIVRGPISDAKRASIQKLQRDLAKRYPGVGDDMDVWFITEEDARGQRPPRHLFRPGASDRSWALHRAHWLAGRYVLLHGVPPSEICRSPSWSELRGALRHEFRFAEDLILQGDAHAYCVLNLSRILYSVRTRKVAVSKPQAARWALRNLPRRYHRLIRAAHRTYERRQGTEDEAVLREGAKPFLSYARTRMHAILRAGTDN